MLDLNSSSLTVGKSSLLGRVTACGLALGLIIGNGHANAASATWTNTGSNAGWADTGNWGGTAPGNNLSGGTASADVATFNSAVGTVGTSGNPVVIDSGRTISGLKFDTASVGSYFIGTTAGNPLYLSSGGAIQSTNTAITANETINAPLVIAGAGATYSFTNNSTSTGTLNFGGTVQGGTAGATVLTLNGTNTGTNTISGNISNGSATSLAITKSGAGAWVLSGTNNYTGATSLTTGTLTFSGTSSMSSGSTLSQSTGTTLQLLSNTSGTFTPAAYGQPTQSGTPTYNVIAGNVSGSGTGNTLVLANAGQFGPGAGGPSLVTLNFAVNNSDTLQLGSGTSGSGLLNFDNNTTVNSTVAGGTLAIPGGLAVNFNKSYTLTFGGAGNISVGSLVQSGANALIVISNSTGTVTLSGADAYTGGTAINSGTVKVASATALGASSGNVSVAAGAALDLNGTTMTNTNALTLNGTGISSGGALTNSGGAGTYAGLVTLGSSGVSIGGAGLITLSNTGTITGATDNLTLRGAGGSVASIIGTTSGSLTVNTTGAWTLNGANTFSGATLISAGTLTLGTGGSVNSSSGVTINGSGAKFLQTNTTTAETPGITVTQGTLDGTGAVGAVTVGNGTGGIVANGNGTSSQLTVGSLTFNGTTVNSGTLRVNIGGGTTFTTPGIVDSGALTTQNRGNGEVTVNVTPTSAWSLGTNTYNLVQFNSLVGSASDFTLGTVGLLTLRESASLGVTSTNLQLTVQVDSPVWSGAGDGSSWTTAATGSNSGPNNWALFSAHTATNFWANDSVLFNDTYNLGAGNVAVTNSAVQITGANVSPVSVAFNNSSVNYTVGSTGGFGIASGSLTKSGTGSVTISTNNSYTGGTTVNAGTLTLSGNNAFGAGTISVTGGQLVLSGSNTYTGTTSVSSGGALQVQNTGALGTSSSVTVASGGALQLRGSGLTVGTSGTLPLTISGAGLASSPAGALDNVTGTNTYAGLLTLGASATIGADAGALALSNTGTITGSGFNLTLAGAGNGSIASIIGTGAGGLIMNSTGSWTLSAANTYTGGTTVNSGTLSLTNVNAVASSAVTLNDTSTLQLLSNSSTTFNESSISLGANSSVTFNVGNVSGSGSGNTISLQKTIALAANSNNTINVTGSNSDTLALGNLATSSSTGGPYTLTVNATTAAATIGTLTAGANGTTAIFGGSNTITIGNFNLNSNGNDGFTVNGANVTVNGATASPGNRSSGTLSVTLNSGTLNINNSAVLSNQGSHGGTYGNFFVINGGTLDNTSGAAITLTPYTGGGNTALNYSAITIGGSFAFGGSNSLNLGLGAVSIGGNRTITLNGNNNNTLAFGGTTSNTTSTAITTTVNNAAGVSGETLSFAGFNLVTGGSGGISDTFNGSGNIAITGVVANGTGSNGIIYSGTGTLTLSGANTYTGPTGINGGIVNLGVAQTGTTSGPLGAGASTQAVTFGGGTLQFSSVNNTDYSARIAAGTSTGAVSIDVNGQTVTFGTALTSTKSGGFTLADSGSGGTLTFSAANSYTGPTTIKSGTLKITGAGLLGATSNALVMNGGGLDLGGTAQSVGNLNGTGAIYNNSGSGNSVLTIGNGDNGGGNFQGVIENYATTSGGTVGVTKTGSASITLSGTNTYTGATIVNGGTLGLTGSLSGSSVSTSGTGVFSESSGAAIGGASSTFTQGSSGTSTLAGTNTYGGATFVSAGILKVQSSGALNASSTAATTISNGATLQIDGRGLSLANKIFIAGAGVSSVGGVYNTTGSNTLSGSIFATNNSATIAAAASTTLTLSGTITAGLNDNRTDHVLTFNTPTGGTINVTGHLQDNGASSGGGVVVNGGLVTFSNDNYNLTENTTLNAGELDLNASAPTVGATGYGNVFVNGGTLKLLANDQINAGASLAVTSGTVSFNGYNQTLLNLTNSGGTINYGSGTVVIIDPTWSGGTNTVVGSTSFGSLDISGGANTINSSGVLSVGGDSAGSGLTFSGTGAPSIIVNSGGKLVLTAGDVTGISTGANDSVNPAIAGLSGTGAALIGGSGQVDLGGGTQTINVASGGTSLEIDPQITNGAINETGAGKLILTGANNYTGGTTIGGTVQVGNGGATGNLGSGDVTNNGSLIYKRTGSLTESNAISGTGSVIQSGPGVVVLANSTGNTYAGGTSVTGGKLYVNNASGSGTGSGAVAISGGTVAGSGNITTSGGISVTAGGTLSSGDIQSGTTVDGTHLSVTDTNVLIASANLTFDLGAGNTVGSGFHTFGTPNLNTTYLSLAGTSTISFSGTDSVSLVDLTGGALSLRQGKPFLLVDGTSNSQYSGLVTSLDGRLDDLTLNGNGFVVGVGTLSSYTTIAVNQFGPDGVTPLTGNNAYYAPVLYLYNGDLEVVPEPGTWALMIGGLALLIVIQRRRNARN